jgi:chromosome segregation ATPase
MDPYYDVQSDTINLLKQLQQTSDRKHQNELIGEIHNQLSDLDDMIQLISNNRTKLMISDRELNRRKQFIKDITTTLQNYSDKTPLINTTFESVQTYLNTNLDEQDTYLIQISDSLERLKQINYDMAEELTAQHILIDDLSQLTEETEDRLREGSKKIDQVKSESKNKPEVFGIVALGATILGLITALVHL